MQSHCSSFYEGKEHVRTFWAWMVYVVGIILAMYVNGYLCLYLGITNMAEGLDTDNGNLVFWGFVQAFVVTEFAGYIIYRVCEGICDYIATYEPAAVYRHTGGATTARQGELAWEKVMRAAENIPDTQTTNESEG